jgi:hypothetical protein
MAQTKAVRKIARPVAMGVMVMGGWPTTAETFALMTGHDGSSHSGRVIVHVFGVPNGRVEGGGGCGGGYEPSSMNDAPYRRARTGVTALTIALYVVEALGELFC